MNFEQVHGIKQTCQSPNMKILNEQRKDIKIIESMPSEKTKQNNLESKAASTLDLPTRSQSDAPK